MQRGKHVLSLHFFGCFCRDWVSMHQQSHVILHIPSMSLGASQRLGHSAASLKRNTQLARLCDLADATVDIVYVSAAPLGEQNPINNILA